MSALTFYLDAPLQSWGASSKFQYRETGNFPTKSAVVGLLAAALGIDKHSSDEREKLNPLQELRLTAIRLGKTTRPVTRLVDFHSIGGGYDKKKSLREKMSIPRKASGPPFGTVITRRYYLNDAVFAVILEGDPSTLDRIRQALLNPVWGTWFGRKTCLPASPLTPTMGDSAQAALDDLLERLPGHLPVPLDHLEYQREILPSEEIDGTFYQSDQPVAFGQHHGPVPAPYRARGVIHHRPVPDPSP
jgi:CRISPR system Cascade subunit CasD